MEDKFREHFLMDTTAIVEYIKEKTDFFKKGATLHAEEIGDGNINYVFRVFEEGGNSLVVKQADKLLRSSGRPLCLDRSRIEAEILSLQGRLVSKYVPKVYFYDARMHALVMEDISEFHNMRKELEKGRKFPKFSEEIAEFLVKSLLPTTDLFMDRAEKKRRVASFINTELCDITEDLVFTEPYYDYKGRNVITEGMEDFVKTRLYEDEALKAEVGILRNSFMNKAEALIHGDLHTGSIFVKEEGGLKVIDPEFAFYGPMGYDIGNVIGNLCFALGRDFWKEEREDFVLWLKKTISEVFDFVKKGLREEMEREISFPIYNKIFQENYVKEIMEESIGFAGTEIIRRIVGDAKVADITGISEPERRKFTETVLLSFGICLIKERRSILFGKEIIERFEEKERSLYRK